MKKIAVLSIPGLPNGFASLDSTLYHNYKPTLKVIEEVAKEKHGKTKTYFDSYIWPRKSKHPWGKWTLYIPGLTIAIWYHSYRYDLEFRKSIVKIAEQKIKKLLKKGDELYLILHSHGNRIGLDALESLAEQKKLPKGKKITVISLAPAYYGVAYGFKKNDISQNHLENIIDEISNMFIFRIKTDFLSGNPPLEDDGLVTKTTPSSYYKVHLFKPKWYEWCFRAHANVRQRSDVMKALKETMLVN